MLPRERLRLLSLEMELQRAWLVAYLDDGEVRAARNRNNVIWRLVMSIVRARSLWLAVIGVGVEWWRKRRTPGAA